MRTITVHRACVASLLGLLFALAPTTARGDTPPAPASASPRLTPPRLVRGGAPRYPEGASGRAVVVLALTVDEQGAVTDARVSEPAGAPFDDAALAAARDLAFEPARRDDTAIAAKIPFRFVFEEPAPVPAPAPAPGSRATVRGVVRTEAGEPVAGARVRVERGADVKELATDAQGAFVADLAETPAGRARVTVTAEGFAPLVVETEPSLPDASAPLALSLAAASAADVEIRGARAPREPTVRAIDAKEVRTMAGANGDPLRALESLPGVARAPAPGGMLLVRGSAPQDTWVSMDGTWLPGAYHFGGLASVIPGDVLEQLEYRPGNFGPEHGRAMGGVVEMKLRSPRKDRWGGLAQIDLLDGRVLAEGPLGARTRVLVAGRRSWVDAWLGPVLRGSGTGVRTAPVYADGQLVLEHDLTDTTTARLAFVASDDRFALLVSSPDSFDPGFGGTFSSRSTLTRAQARLETRLDKDTRWTTTASYGTESSAFTGGDNRVDTFIHLGQLRSELRGRVSRHVTASAGLDLLYAFYDVTLLLPGAAGLDDPAPGPIFAVPTRRTRGSAHIFRPAAYTQLEITPTRGLVLMPGLRADAATDNKSTTVDPRLAARWDVTAGEHRTTLKGGLGVYHQPPLNESLAPWGDPSVKNMRAIHASAGVEQQLGRSFEVSVEGFAKDLDDLIVPRAAETSTTSGVRYVNTGSGTVRGLEVLAKLKPTGRFSGWLAYTLSRSERRDADGEPSYLFRYDQTHVLSALGSVDLGRGWSLGARFRYVTGSPTTPFVGGVVDADAGAYQPVQGARWSSRLPDFHRLDLRVEKSFHAGPARLAAYLDVQNVTNAKNPEGLVYRYDYAKSEPATGLPVLPILGLRGEL